jgi:carboxymethylenebutenolidase
MTLRIVAVLAVVVAFTVACGGSSESPSEEAADQMAEAHEGDRPDATGATQAPATPVAGRTVTYHTTDDGTEVQGFLAAPQQPDSILEARGLDPSTASLPGLVVIHEWWGLNDNIRRATRRLAGQGYRALAVDLYGGESADSPSGARDLMQAAMDNRSALGTNLQAAHTYLRGEWSAPRTAVMGWCFGGGMTVEAAVQEPERWNGAVIYYGSVGDVTEEQLQPIAFPILGHFGAEDGNIPVEDVRRFETILSDMDKDAQMYVYEGAGHAFANPSGTSYDAEAAATAWDRTTAFFERTLYEPLSQDMASN